MSGCPKLHLALRVCAHISEVPPAPMTQAHTFCAMITVQQYFLIKKGCLLIWKPDSEAFGCKTLNY